ncbi:hypothetical protein [Hymenobacter profundi]|nr:hypothetical protein [Hymenobacter profundi]
MLFELLYSNGTFRHKNTMVYSWLAPWAALPEGSAKTFHQQLQQELTPLHPLYGIPALPIGKNGGTDDVLYQLPDQRFAVVHLVWTRRGDSEYPQTNFFDNWTAFVTQRMELDNVGYES